MSIGLVRKPVHPASRHFSSSPRMAWAVSAMIGVFKPLLPQQPGGGVAVHDRHLHVHQDHVVVSRQRHVRAGLPVFGPIHDRPGALQHQRDQLAIGNAVFHQQHARADQVQCGLSQLPARWPATR